MGQGEILKFVSATDKESQRQHESSGDTKFRNLSFLTRGFPISKIIFIDHLSCLKYKHYVGKLKIQDFIKMLGLSCNISLIPPLKM